MTNCVFTCAKLIIMDYVDSGKTPIDKNILMDLLYMTTIASAPYLDKDDQAHLKRMYSKVVGDE